MQLHCDTTDTMYLGCVTIIAQNILYIALLEYFTINLIAI